MDLTPRLQHATIVLPEDAASRCTAGHRDTWLHREQRALLCGEALGIVDGVLQRRKSTTSVLAERFAPLPVSYAMQAPESHDFG